MISASITGTYPDQEFAPGAPSVWPRSDEISLADGTLAARRRLGIQSWRWSAKEAMLTNTPSLWCQ